nr:hypothetical transcript [Hymenolepis microstoma]
MGEAPFPPFAPTILLPLYSYSIALSYPYGTPVLGFMTTIKPASRKLSSRKHTAVRYSTIPMDYRVRASTL